MARWMITVAFLIFSTAGLSNTKEYSLRFKLFEGKTWAIREKQTMSAEFPAFPGNNMFNKGEYTATYKVDKAREDGSFEVVVVLSDGKMEGGNMFMSPMDISGLQGKPIRMIVSPDGNIRDVFQPEGLEESAVPSFQAVKEGHLNFGFNTFLPHKDVAIGETWVTNRPIIMEIAEGEIEMLLEVESKLEGVEKIQKNEYLKVTFEGEFNGTLRQGWATINGKIMGSYLFDLERGEVLRMNMEMDQGFSINDEKGVVNGEIKTKMSSERVEDVGVH